MSEMKKWLDIVNGKLQPKKTIISESSCECRNYICETCFPPKNTISASFIQEGSSVRIFNSVVEGNGKVSKITDSGKFAVVTMENGDKQTFHISDLDLIGEDEDFDNELGLESPLSRGEDIVSDEYDYYKEALSEDEWEEVPMGFDDEDEFMDYENHVMTSSYDTADALGMDRDELTAMAATPDVKMSSDMGMETNDVDSLVAQVLKLQDETHDHKYDASHLYTMSPKTLKNIITTLSEGKSRDETFERIMELAGIDVSEWDKKDKKPVERNLVAKHMNKVNKSGAMRSKKDYKRKDKHPKNYKNDQDV